MDSRLGARVPNDTDGLTGAFARAGIGLCALTAHRQTAQVADATIAFDTLEALEIHADLAAQVTFDDILAVLNRVDDERELLFGQVFGADAGIEASSGQDLFRVSRTNTVDVTQSDVDAFVRRNFYTNNTSHKWKLVSPGAVCDEG